MRDVHITPAVADFDAAMREAYREPSVVYLEDGHYLTAGVNPWNRTPERGFIIDGQLIMGDDTIIEIDGSKIPDALVNNEPLVALKGRGVWDKFGRDLTPQQVWDALPVEQTVIGGKVICNHSKFVDRWRGLGFPLRTVVAQLHGHGQLISKVTGVDIGAWRTDPAVGAETFPFACTGVDGSMDSTPIVQLDPATHIFSATTRAPEISDCTFSGYVPEASNDQVTVSLIVGAFGEAAGWNLGDWRYTWLSDWLMTRNTVLASGKNLVQAFTAYLGKKGRCVGNYTEGADIGFYGDYLQSENSTIETNQFLKCRHGVSLYLSTTPRPLSDNFYHKGYRIGPNKIDSRDQNVSLNTYNDQWIKYEGGVDPAQRVIEGIGVHSSLSVEALNGASYYVIDPVKPAPKTKFCPW